MNKTHCFNKLNELRKTFGDTPMLKIELSYKGEIKSFYVKEEYVSPTRSIKVRPAYQIIHDAIVFDELKPNQPVIEVTSGNMGIFLAYICKYLGWNIFWCQYNWRNIISISKDCNSVPR